MSHDTTTHSHISLEFGAVLKRTATRFEKIFLPMLTLFAVALLSVLAGLGIIAAISFGVHYIMPIHPVSLALLATFVIMSTLALLYGLMVVTVMNVHILEKPTFNFLPLFKKSYKEVLPVFAILIVTGLGELGGYVLGILPGIWLSVILSFVTIIAVLEKKGLKHSISKSAYLVKNDFWNVVVFALFAVLGSLLLSMLPIVGTLLQIIFGIFTYIMTFELYKTLEHNKKSENDETKYSKNIVLVTKIFAACAVLILVILATLASFILATMINQQM